METLQEADDQLEVAVNALNSKCGTASVGTKGTCKQVRRLTSRLDDQSLIRGVRLSTALRNFGQAFSTKTGGISVNEADYDESEVVEELDDFLSHDWGSGRWLKLLTLLCQYNSNAAFVASMMAATVLCILQQDFAPSSFLHTKYCEQEVELGGEIYKTKSGMWCTAICPPVFFCCFFFWQRIHDALRLPPRKIFLDKFCVDQVEERRKIAAIMGLAGFLRHSKRLLICWTPAYFTRLWCVYEIASWYHIQKEDNKLKLVPLSLASMLVESVLILCVFYSTKPAGLPGGVRIFLSICILAALMYAVLRSIRDLSHLPDQLAEFSIDKAKCFCCANNHKMPHSGKTIPCDRRLVRNTVAGWYAQLDTNVAGGDSRELEEGALEEFDVFVKTTFASKLLSAASSVRPSYQYVIICCSPVLWYAGDVLTSEVSEGSVPYSYIAREALFHFSMALLVIPTVSRLLCHILPQIDRVTKAPSKPTVDKLLAPVRLLVGVALFCAFGAPLFSFNRSESVYGLFAYLLPLTLFTYVLYKEPKWLGLEPRRYSEASFVRKQRGSTSPGNVSEVTTVTLGNGSEASAVCPHNASMSTKKTVQL